MQIWPRNIVNRNVKHKSHGDVIELDVYLEAMSKAMTIGDGIVDRIV